MEQDKKCKDRVKSHLTSRMSDLRKLFKAWCNGDEYIEDLGNLNEYGLSFDYVPAGTFSDQKVGFFRYQLSTGGPGDEFRFYTDGQFNINKIEYWFLDWFDGAKVTLHGDRFDLVARIFIDYFAEAGCVQSEYQKACNY